MLYCTKKQLISQKYTNRPKHHTHLLYFYSVLLAKWRKSRIFGVKCIYSIEVYLEDFAHSQRVHIDMTFKAL